MAKCIPIGWIKENGECAIFQEINDNGLILLECGDIEWVAAECPNTFDKGGIQFGPQFVKFASVNAALNQVVQRDGALGLVFTGGFQVAPDPGNVGDCLTGNFSRLFTNDASIGEATPVTLGPGVETARVGLRRYGDLVAFGGDGSIPDSDVGLFEIITAQGAGTGQDGDVESRNYCAAFATAGTHRWLNRNVGVGDQLLMELTPTAGNLYFPAWTYISDELVKSGIVALDPQKSLEVVMAVSPIAYTMNGKRYSGFSAQDVQKHLPDAVGELKDGTLTLRPDDLLATLFSAVKALTARVQELEAKVG